MKHLSTDIYFKMLKDYLCDQCYGYINEECFKDDFECLIRMKEQAVKFNSFIENEEEE